MKPSVRYMYLITVAILAINNLSLIKTDLIPEARVNRVLVNNSLLESYEYDFYETPVLNYVSINRGSISYDTSIPLSYQFVNLDRDKYVDLVIWYPKRIVFWSLTRDVMLEVGSGPFYFSNPILIDLNSDGLVDYFVLVYNDKLDGYPSPSRNPFIEVRDINGHVNTIYVNLPIHIDSQTHYVFNGRLFIPWIRNTYSVVHVGLIEVDFNKQQETRVHQIAVFSGSCSTTICDLNTNYEVYLIGYRDIIYLFPSGSDTLLVVNIENNGVKLVETVKLGYETIDDTIVLLGRNRVSLNVAGEGYNQAMQPFTYEWFGTRKTCAVFDGRFIITPYGTVLAQPTDIYYGGTWYPIRIERVNGVFVFDTLMKTYRYVDLLIPVNYGGITYNPTTLTAVSVNPDTRTVYFGGLAYVRTTYNVRYVYYVGSYRYDTRQLIHPIWVEALPIDGSSRNMNIALSEDGSIQASPEKVRLATLTSLYEYILHAGRAGTYWNTKTILLNPVLTDIDGDNALDVVSILYYAWGDGALYSGRYYFSCLIPRAVDTKSNYVVWFTIPRSKITLQYSDETKHQVLLSLNYVSRGDSNLTISVKYQDGNTVFNKILKAGNHSEIIVLNTAGNYSVLAKPSSSYRVGGRLDTAWTTVTYIKELNITMFRVRYPTRLTIEEPRIHVLTPNLYVNGLRLIARLERYDWDSERWVNVPGGEVKLLFNYGGRSYCYVVKDYLESPEYSPPRPPRLPSPPIIPTNDELVDSIRPCESSVPLDIGYGGASAPYNGVYGIVLENLALESVVSGVRIHYAGSQIHLPAELMINDIRLVKYPVIVSVDAVDAYALRSHTLLVRVSYLYYEANGDVKTAFVQDGYVTYVITNTSSGTTTCTGRSTVYNGSALITVLEEHVLPGAYNVEVFFEPTSNVYSTAGVTVSYFVNKLGFRTEAFDLLVNRTVSNNDIVSKFSMLKIQGFETAGLNNTYVSTGLRVEIIDLNDKVSVIVNYTPQYLLDIDLSVLEENKTYLLIVEPGSYRWVYDPSRVTYLLKTVPLGGVEVFVEPLMLETGSDRDIYALTENKVYIRVVLNTLFRNSLEKVVFKNANFTLWIGGEKHDLHDSSEAVLWYPVKPGLWNITGEVVADAGLRSVKLTGSKIVRVKPMPTVIEVERGSIRIDVYDMLGRKANGTMNVEIRALSGRLICRNTYRYDSETVIINVEANDWVYVNVVFRGNGSYADSWRLVPIDLSHTPEIPAPTPLNEPFPALIIFITLLVAIVVLVRRRNGVEFAES